MKLCLLCENEAAALGADVVGGIENQVQLLASHLAARGHDTTLVVPGMSGGPRPHRGIRIVSGWDPDMGRPGVRSFTYRLPHLRQTLAQLAADAYYICGYSHLAPSLVAAARDVGACSLLALASDVDLRPAARSQEEASAEACTSARRRVCSPHCITGSAGLRRASCVVAQTKRATREMSTAWPSLDDDLKYRRCATP